MQENLNIKQIAVKDFEFNSGFTAKINLDIPKKLDFPEFDLSYNFKLETYICNLEINSTKFKPIQTPKIDDNELLTFAFKVSLFPI